MHRVLLKKCRSGKIWKRGGVFVEQRKEQLLKAVKTAAAQFGLDGATTRIISEIAGVNDAYIYRYFKDREELLAQAYKMESNELIKKVNDIAVYCHSSTELHLPDAANIVLHPPSLTPPSTPMPIALPNMCWPSAPAPLRSCKTAPPSPPSSCRSICASLRWITS